MSRDKDWRLRSQEDYVNGATVLRKRCKAWSADWEHDHCEFCWAKFMDPAFSPEHARFIAKHPEVLTKGYAVQGRRPDETDGPVMGRIYSADGAIEEKAPSPTRDDYWWICPQCVADFAERFQWRILEGPADCAEPKPLTPRTN